jgi:hypothetical protein
MTHDLFRRARSLPWLCFGLLVFSSALTADVPVGQDRGGQGRSGGGAPQSPSTVEFLVLGNDGQPVTDLKAEEVSLRIAGRERKIESLELKRFSGGAPGAAPAAPSAPPPFATNAGGGSAAAPGRVFMFVIEDTSVRPGDERPIRASIEKLLGTLAPNDRVGILTTPNPTVRLDPTTDRARVTEALGRVSGQRPGSMSSGDRACRTRDSLVALRNILPVLQTDSGLATVVFFSAQLEQAATGGASTSGAGCMVSTDLFQGIASTSAASRAHIFVVQAEESVSQRSEGLENLASVSGGGQVFPLVSSGDPVARIARETAAYYVASFRPEQNDRVGGGQRLELRVSREGVHARSYGEYTFRAGAAAAGAPGNVREMLKSPGNFADVPIRLAAFPARAAGEKLRVLVLVEPGTPETKFASAAVGMIDAKNSMRQIVLDDKMLALPTAIVPFEVDPGSYRVRVAATDAAGKGGTVEYNLDANLTPAGPIKLSAMLLGAMRGTGFTPVMQFKDEEQAVVYVEAYGDRGQSAVSAKVELVGADGKVMQEFQPGGSGTSEPDKVILTAGVPLKDLKPGDYLLRLRFQLQGQAEGVVSQTLRKVQ